MDKMPETLREAFRDGMADGLVDKFYGLPRAEQKSIMLKMAFVDQCHVKINEITHNEKLDTEEMAAGVLHHISVLGHLYSTIDDLCKIEQNKGKKNGK